MKTSHSNLDRLIPWVAIVVVAGGIVAAVTYIGLERKIHSGQALAATLDRLYQAQKLSSVLRCIHEGDVSKAAWRLDLMVCDDVLALNAQLASADVRTRITVKDGFERIAHLRPKSARLLGVASQELCYDQIEAERILAEACGSSIMQVSETRSRP
jgi:hypothetical protein